MQAPFAVVVLFGMYMLVLLAHGVATYRDCPAEAASLQKVSTALWYDVCMLHGTMSQTDKTSLFAVMTGHCLGTQ